MLFNVVIGNPPYSLPNNKNIFQELVRTCVLLFNRLVKEKNPTIESTLNIPIIMFNVETKPLREIEGVFIGRGLTTGCNKVFIINENKYLLDYRDVLEKRYDKSLFWFYI